MGPISHRYKSIAYYPIFFYSSINLGIHVDKQLVSYDNIDSSSTML